MKTLAGRLKNLLTVNTTAITHQAAPAQNAMVSFCSEPPLKLNRRRGNHRVQKILYRAFHRVPADGAAAHQTGRVDALLHRGRRRRNPQTGFWAFDFIIAGQGSRFFEGRGVVERAVEINRQLSVVVVARQFEMECDLEAMQLGAVDCVADPSVGAEIARLMQAHLRHHKT
jgi:hypothetical protein